MPRQPCLVMQTGKNIYLHFCLTKEHVLSVEKLKV